MRPFITQGDVEGSPVNADWKRAMIARLTAVVLLIPTLTTLGAQSPTPTPKFEIASVRQNTSGTGTTSFSMPATGTIRITNAPIRSLIFQAYQVSRFSLVAASDISRLGRTLTEDMTGPRFDIEAKPPEDAAPGQQRLMLQRLLADRFKLRVHLEKRPVPVYVLRTARDGRLGPDLVPTKQDCLAWASARQNNPQIPEPSDRNGNPLCLLGPASRHPGLTLLGNAGPAAGIARQIQFYLDRLLIDETGLTGNFAWRLSFALNSQGTEHPSIFTAVQEQLGLTLEPRMSPSDVDALVVDSVELPTPN
jgi:uncharacterized protein (TIGR03435 family)